MQIKLNILIAAVALFASARVLRAEEEVPLHLVISEVGNRSAIYGTGDSINFSLMAEIEDSLNFGLRGDFEKAEVLSALTVAPDGKTYELKVVGEHPPTGSGLLMQFLRIHYGDAHPDFSIGKWKVMVKFKVDGEEYKHEAEHRVTWRKYDEGIWSAQHWAQETTDEQVSAGQPATRVESDSEGGDKSQPESEGRSQ